jgi:hypothetical protein
MSIQLSATEPGSDTPGMRLMRGAALGLEAGRRELDGRHGVAGTLGHLLHSAAIGALYSAVEEAFRFPSLQTVLEEKPSTAPHSRSRHRQTGAGEVSKPARLRAARDAPVDTRPAVRALHAGAAALSFSVVADSGLEHYRKPGGSGRGRRQQRV